MQTLTIGLLPLYIELYDQSTPEMRPRIERFAESIATAFEQRGFRVVRVPICRLHKEFETAVRTIEDEKADCIVTLHLAYSPSLESDDVLAGTSLPIVVLDTTDTYEFCDPEDILYCHGIHGVMDMCNLLHRHNKPFTIAAGHWKKSDVLDRTAALIRSAVQR